MSKFSTYLKRLIADSGESISSLARTIGAERTSIHKALADERILSYKTVQALARHFNLSVDERKDFCLFWTAYPTTYSHTKEKLMKEYTEYWKKQDK